MLVEESHTLIVVDNIAQMVTSAVVSFAHTHGVVGEVDIAVVALMGQLELRLSWLRRCINVQKTGMMVSLSHTTNRFP